MASKEELDATAEHLDGDDDYEPPGLSAAATYTDLEIALMQTVEDNTA